MILKYLMYETIFSPTGAKLRLPVFFNEHLTHVQMHEALEGSEGLLEKAELVGAGFIDSDRLMPYGESESLKQIKQAHKPLPDDFKVMQTYDFMHGIIGS